MSSRLWELPLRWPALTPPLPVSTLYRLRQFRLPNVAMPQQYYSLRGRWITSNSPTTRKLWLPIEQSDWSECYNHGTYKYMYTNWSHPMNPPTSPTCYKQPVQPLSFNLHVCIYNHRLQITPCYLSFEYIHVVPVWILILTRKQWLWGGMSKGCKKALQSMVQAQYRRYKMQKPVRNRLLLTKLGMTWVHCGGTNKSNVWYRATNLNIKYFMISW